MDQKLQDALTVWKRLLNVTSFKDRDELRLLYEAEDARLLRDTNHALSKVDEIANWRKNSSTQWWHPEYEAEVNNRYTQLHNDRALLVLAYNYYYAQTPERKFTFWDFLLGWLMHH